MPEGDTIFKSARTLNLALAGRRVTGFETQLPQLSRVDYDTPLAGRTVEKVESVGKWIRMYFSNDLILVTHMLMSGSWHIYRPLERWQRPKVQMRVAIANQDYVAVAFQVPIAEFHTASTLVRHRSVRGLGQDVLGEEFDPATAVESLRSCPQLEVGEALLNQTLMAGVGNVFKSEVCFVSGINPFRLVQSLSDYEVAALVNNAQRLLKQNVAAGAGAAIVTYTGSGTGAAARGLWVYQRRGECCRKCGTAIVAYKQGPGARSTFWCPQCQPMVKAG